MAVSNEQYVRDVSLLAELSAGNSSVFWELWAAHSARLYGICLREMSGNRADAEDALGEAMLRAFDKLPRHAHGIERIDQWLSRLTSNVCMDIHRGRRRGMKVAAELGIHIHHCVPFEELRHDTRANELDPAALIALLPDRLREVFVLRVLQNLPYEAIAARLQLTSANARKRVQQARAALRTMRDHGMRRNFGGKKSGVNKVTNVRLLNESHGSHDPRRRRS